MRPYGQYCPISRAAEILGDRWSLLILRDLMTGTDRFNDLARGLPGLSRGLLSKRLDQLVRHGLVTRLDDGTYGLTEAGRDLFDVLWALGRWGARWSFGDPEETELDPDLLVWWVHRGIDVDRLPGPRFVVHLRFRDHPSQYWIVVEEDASVCLADPGFPVDVAMVTTRGDLYQVWLGRRTVTDLLRGGELEASGTAPARRALWSSLRLSAIAPVVREAGLR